MILTGKTPDLVIRALLQYHQQSSNSKAVWTGEGNDECCLIKQLLHMSKGSLTCRKIWWHGPNSFTSPPKGSVLQIFYHFWKSTSLGLGSKGKHANH
jgi:hypothetical protein